LKESIPHLLLPYRDRLYDDPTPCPECGSEKRNRYDKQPRIFATIITQKGFQQIRVWVKRYVCKDCGRIYASRSPFYPGCLYGNLVIDLCLFLSAANPFCRVEALLQQWGLQVDRDTVRNYVKRFGERARSAAGTRIDQSCVAVNLVRLLFDLASVEELAARMPGEVFQDVADETYPAVKGAKKSMRDENTERTLQGQPPVKYPQSHTLATCYEARHRFFLSVLVTPTAFNTMLADALCAPARGCVGSVRDGSTCYRGEHIQCANHKARRLIARDPEYRRLKREATCREQVRDYCLRYYSNVKEKEAAKAAQRYPDLVQDGVFVGALSTNSMEGGNWRIKYSLAVPYKDPALLEARLLLIAVSDSVKTFKAGRPQETFAQVHGCFAYSTIMAQTSRPERVGTGMGSGLGHGPGDGSDQSARQGGHTEIFALWLEQSIQRAAKKQAEKEVTTTTTD